MTQTISTSPPLRTTDWSPGLALGNPPVTHSRSERVKKAISLEVRFAGKTRMVPGSEAPTGAILSSREVFKEDQKPASAIQFSLKSQKAKNSPAPWLWLPFGTGSSKPRHFLLRIEPTEDFQLLLETAFKFTQALGVRLTVVSPVAGPQGNLSDAFPGLREKYSNQWAESARITTGSPGSIPLTELMAQSQADALILACPAPRPWYAFRKDQTLKAVQSLRLPTLWVPPRERA